MKVAIFADAYYPQINGVITSITSLKKGLEEQGHEVFIITVKVPGYVEPDPEHIIRVSSIPFFKWDEFRVATITRFSSAYRRLKKLNFDIIHTQYEFPLGRLGQLLAKELNIPLIHTYHTIYEEYTHYFADIGTKYIKKFARYYTKKFTKPCDAVIVPSIKTKKLLENYGVKNKMYVIPSGLNLENFARPANIDVIEQAKKNYKLTDDIFKIVLVGRVSQEKNMSLLIDVIPDILKTHSNVKVIVVGDGPHKPNLEEQVKKLHLTDTVFFTGRIANNEIGSYYKLGDLFVNTSKTETQGLTIIEAILSHIPILVYDDTNIEGIIFDKQNGLLFKTRDDLIEKLNFAISNKDKITEYAKTAYNNSYNFSDKKFGDEVVKVYKECIANKNNGVPAQQT